jgi:hypothetical protein
MSKMVPFKATNIRQLPVDYAGIATTDGNKSAVSILVSDICQTCDL